MRRVVLVGATSGIALACARLWNVGAVHFTLIGRSDDRLRRAADDLRVRNPLADVTVSAGDLLDAAFVSRIVDDLEGSPVDVALIAQGTLPDQTAVRTPTAVADALAVNAVSPAMWAEAVAGVMEQRGRGTLILLGSVAGDRGRRSNYAYGSAKSLLATFAGGLQHRLAGSGVRVLLVKPGPTATAMTDHLKGRRLASVQTVAADIDRAARRGDRMLYTPNRWRVIMTAVRAIPSPVFDRLDL